MYEFPDELWNLIKDFTFDKSFWEKLHKHKMKHILKPINGYYKEIYIRWTHFPPWPNTNDIIRAEYANNNFRFIEYAPRPNLPLTSICYNVKGNGGWWCGYGWQKKQIIDLT